MRLSVAIDTLTSTKHNDELQPLTRRSYLNTKQPPHQNKTFGLTHSATTRSTPSLRILFPHHTNMPRNDYLEPAWRCYDCHFDNPTRYIDTRVPREPTTCLCCKRHRYCTQCEAESGHLRGMTQGEHRIGGAGGTSAEPWFCSGGGKFWVGGMVL
jgi:hypothetical protein